jgi:hypothetical protein
MLVEAIRGPLMLILLGALLAADQAEKLDIGRTWPALLILYGLLKLAERITPRPTQPPPHY